MSSKTPAGTHRQASWARRIRDAQAGDIAAFEALVRDYQAGLYAFAVAYMGCRADAADVAQDALVKAFRRIHTYRFEASFRTWLLQIVRHTCQDRLRQRQRRNAGLRRLEQAPDLPSSPPSPERILQAREATELIHAALEQVDPIFREVVILFDLQGLSHAEIAEICDSPVGTVKSRLSRGREALRRVLITSHGKGVFSNRDVPKTGTPEGRSPLGGGTTT